MSSGRLWHNTRDSVIPSLQYYVMLADVIVRHSHTSTTKIKIRKEIPLLSQTPTHSTQNKTHKHKCIASTMYSPIGNSNAADPKGSPRDMDRHGWPQLIYATGKSRERGRGGKGSWWKRRAGNNTGTCLRHKTGRVGNTDRLS